MHWKKLAKLFVANKLHPALQSHASYPTPVHLEKNRYRIFYSARDNSQRSSISYIDIAITAEQVEVININPEPVLTPGKCGHFDDSGVSPACIVKVDNRYWMYYLGWNLGVTIPFRNTIGLAISDDGHSFERVQQTPVLDRNPNDPIGLSYPFVLKIGDNWHMWYGSSLSWGAAPKDISHVIKHASSKDGMNWITTEEISVDSANDEEQGILRPFVLFEEGIYKMWYCFRGEQYQMGYAESNDGTHFVRKDDLAGIKNSQQGWDSKSVEYPSLLDHGHHRYLLYNGNNYGKTGFGIAIKE